MQISKDFERALAETTLVVGNTGKVLRAPHVNGHPLFVRPKFLYGPLVLEDEDNPDVMVRILCMLAIDQPDQYQRILYSNLHRLRGDALKERIAGHDVFLHDMQNPQTGEIYPAAQFFCLRTGRLTRMHFYRFNLLSDPFPGYPASMTFNDQGQVAEAVSYLSPERHRRMFDLKEIQLLNTKLSENSCPIAFAGQRRAVSDNAEIVPAP